MQRHKARVCADVWAVKRGNGFANERGALRVMSTRDNYLREPSMWSTQRWCLFAAITLLTAACGPQEGNSAPATAQTPPTAAAAASDTSAGAMPHGDHNPHHGGVVYMYDDMHYEVVFAADGHHRLYFSDATREDLPASVAASVSLTFDKPTGASETLKGEIDESGESWLLTGPPITGTVPGVRVTFDVKGHEYWIDVPFIAATQ